MTRKLLALTSAKVITSESLFQRKEKLIHLNSLYYDENNLEVISILWSWYGMHCIFSMGKDLCILNTVIISGKDIQSLKWDIQSTPNNIKKPSYFEWTCIKL